jgi:hypothetical protein
MVLFKTINFRFLRTCLLNLDFSSMVYIVAIFFAVLCIGIIIYVIKVYKEDKKTGPQDGFRFDDDDDDDDFLYRR